MADKWVVTPDYSYRVRRVVRETANTLIVLDPPYTREGRVRKSDALAVGDERAMRRLSEKLVSSRALALEESLKAESRHCERVAALLAPFATPTKDTPQ